MTNPCLDTTFILDQIRYHWAVCYIGLLKQRAGNPFELSEPNILANCTSNVATQRPNAIRIAMDSEGSMYFCFAYYMTEQN